ncbi:MULTISPECIES: L-lactate permease [Acidobacteriaceae]|uniref:L-lactate permease n=1 Tax=Acidobacteriaceae TaxID=204434 RepID=UPI00131CB311|nr:MULTISPECIES: lactate permease LctP family transporter [Acidobacteriaceae]MDW5264700.1 lactate permease LctP family transporter [Edaphobacter sp.]
MAVIVIWNQTYSLFGHGLALSAIIAAAPIFTLLILLGIMKKAAWIAGLAGLAVTLVVAIAGYHMPPLLATSAAVYGAAFGLFPISWIIFWAIALFRVTVETGQFEVIRDSVGRLTPDPRLQALLIAFAFGAFLEGGAGFGTPVAIAATMLVGLGFSAFSASAICLLANTAPVAFGSIGIPVITLAGTTGLSLEKLSGAVGRICAPISLIIPAYIIMATGGFVSLSGIWLPALTCGAVFAGVQFLVSNYVGPQLTDILAALSSLAALIVYLRFWHPTGQESGPSIRNCLDQPIVLKVDRASEPEEISAPIDLSTKNSLGKILYAWMPYAFLVICVLLWGVVPIQAKLNLVSFSFPWPFLNDVVRKMPPIAATPTPYHAMFSMNLLSAAGTACMVATFLAAICLRVSPLRFARLLIAVTRQLLLPILTISAVLAIGFLMNYCGATATLGLSFAASGVMFPFFSPLLGWLGVFLTGSDTAANALFGNLQVVTAGRLGLDPVLMAAANSVGGVMGKMISLQTIAIAAAATGLSVPDQSRLFRFTLKHSIFLASLAGCLALIYTYVIHIR